ncbi:MAG: ABC-three component system middle component 8 [Verrucomicrobiales bacterium]
MIRPAKHLNLNTCVLRAASRLLARLQRERICRFADLRTSLAGLGDDAEVVFLPALHFLYLLGRVDYHPQTDSLEYIEPRKGDAA